MVLYDLGVEKDFHFLYFEDVKGEDGGGADSFISAARPLKDFGRNNEGPPIIYM